MQIQFSDSDPQSVIKKLEDAMGGRQLGNMVQFGMSGNDMIVTISKLGTSTLTFKCDQTPKGCHFALTKEKIALTHRPLKGEVTDKIVKVIQKAGGQVSGN
ncbi:MAG TPA: hypothetical protein VE954_08020 [Oligoflexus sp.]|uniref:hypothetical protein n=1 Tax=Oligoflexus sp. TaxID=1971216 RepID=UPI002D5140B0|nr:hypothetical protein [Oligoflexus sp.]HYX33048.1 hypothetical protein [Oligoflexus sp.]